MNGNKNLLKGYVIANGQNGAKYALYESVPGTFLTLPIGTNSKIGNAMSYSHSIEYTCNHTCECYKEQNCYGCHGCYLFGSNQATYTNNYKFYRLNGSKVFAAAVIDAIKKNHVKRFRWFGVGDIVDTPFLQAMVEIAKACPKVEFWGYTKKYQIVNNWIDANGDLPVNLVLIFSHWLNKDGTYFPMDNRHNLPTSEFVPVGMEHIIDTTKGHVCPCSDPDFIGTCADCETPCSRLKKGEAMYLLEHSTAAARDRDKAIHKARKEKKAAAKKR